VKGVAKRGKQISIGSKFLLVFPLPVRQFLPNELDDKPRGALNFVLGDLWTVNQRSQGPNLTLHLLY
jgi:hypothetical protein